MKLDKLSKRSIVLIFGVVLILGSLLYGKFLENNVSNRYHNHKMDNKDKKPNYDMVNKDNTIKDNFSTHLPLVIIDTNGEKPKPDSRWDEEKGYRVPVDYDPYVKGNISIIDNKDNVNSIKDKPSMESNIKIRLRGNSSLEFDKSQYFIKLIDANGNKNNKDVLGMGKDWEWILNISFIDKSLLRNYIALNISGEIMPNTPDVRYCEVIIKDKNKYNYQGVYLIMENIKQGEDRVNIADYDKSYAASSYLLRRDRYDETGVMMNNYATKNHLTPGYLDIKYPSKKDITEETINYITEDINNFEKAIFSENPKEFYKYREYINEQSFIDYFIINEFFANYDAGYNSTYAHKDKIGKLKMGPVWDFDHDLDNFDHTKLKLDTTAMHDVPWIRQLLRDKGFVYKLIERYHYLRQGILSEKNIINYIDETIEFIGPAQMRDWNRWGYFYKGKYLFDSVDKEGNIIDRNTKTYAEEIEKMKNILIEHGRWLDENIDSLYQFSEKGLEENTKIITQKVSDFIFGEKGKISTSTILSVIFIGVFIISIILVERY